MKEVDKYYNKVYRSTKRLTKKLFGRDVTGALALRYALKTSLEQITSKRINDITADDIVKNKIGARFAEYKTVSKILEVLETARTLKTFTIKEYEDEC